MKEDIRAITFRVPLDLKEWLAEQASEHSRSVSGQIIALLKKAKQETGASA